MWRVTPLVIAGDARCRDRSGEQYEELLAVGVHLPVLPVAVRLEDGDETSLSRVVAVVEGVPEIRRDLDERGGAVGREAHVRGVEVE
jgi:hypothetical protein